MPSVASVGLPRFQALDNNGKPLSGGKLFTYLAGSSTLAPTYTDATGNVANPNPLVLNGRGEGVIWLDVTLVYKFVVTTPTGAVLTSDDNIRVSSGGGGDGSVIAYQALTSASQAVATASAYQAASGSALVGFMGDEGGEVPINVAAFIKGFITPQRFGAQADGVHDDAPAMNLALATGKFVECREGDYAIGSSLNVTGGSGITGHQERTRLLRKFTGGAMVRYPGGTDVGTPITLRDFLITTDPSITPVLGDTGVDLGFASQWVGRGDIGNLTILGQFDGFKWTRGSVNPIRNVQVYEGLGNGFLGINPRGELHECLSESNLGHGYLLYTLTSGETGVRLIHCGTFANQMYGLILDAATGQSGANVWADHFSSSFDGVGGIFCAKQYTQCRLSSPFIEYAGNAHAIHASMPLNNSAVGLTLGAGVTNAIVSDAQILHCQGAGATFDATVDVTVNGLQLKDNGQGLQSGAARNGVNIQNGNVRLAITGVSGSVAGSTQLNDIAINTTDNTGLIDGAVIHSFYAVPQTTPGLRTSDIHGLPTANVAATPTLSLPIHADVIIVNAQSNVDAITASWPSREVQLITDGAMTFANGNNLHLNGSMAVMTANSTLSLVAVGNEWFETSRTNDR